MKYFSNDSSNIQLDFQNTYYGTVIQKNIFAFNHQKILLVS